jgi:hypothetical protein
MSANEQPTSGFKSIFDLGDFLEAEAVRASELERRRASSALTCCKRKPTRAAQDDEARRHAAEHLALVTASDGGGIFALDVPEDEMVCATLPPRFRGNAGRPR